MDEFTSGDHQAPTIAGNVPDPDAAVLNTLVEQDAIPPTPVEEPSSPVIPLDTPRLASRMLTQSIKVDPTWSPFMVLPADPRRLSLRIHVISDTATDYIRIADDAGKLQALSASALVYVNDICALDNHTGPLWVYAPDAANPVTLSVIAVSE